MRALLSGALDTAKANGGNASNAVSMGYCFSGAAVLEMARSGADMKGFVSFHGGLKTPQGQDYKSTKGPLLVLHGSADKIISLDDFISLTKELETTGVDNEMIAYSGARHAFTVIGSQRYHEEAEKNHGSALGISCRKCFKSKTSIHTRACGSEVSLYSKLQNSEGHMQLGTLYSKTLEQHQ